MQRFNAILLHDSLPAFDCTGWLFIPIFALYFFEIPSGSYLPRSKIVIIITCAIIQLSVHSFLYTTSISDRRQHSEFTEMLVFFIRQFVTRLALLNTDWFFSYVTRRTRSIDKVFTFCNGVWTTALKHCVKYNVTPNEKFSKWVGRVQHPTRHITGHFGDESFQAINCTGTDNQKQGIKALHIPETQNTNRKKPVLANKTK